ncbi:MAG: hypothetical protein ABI461_22990 [Polyangiaceae bacterium]
MSAPAKKERVSPLPPRGELVDLDDWLDSIDVPAAVVCARCGSVDCTGCAATTERSGFISVIAWERSDAPLLRRLWQTARATTREPERFFESLPEGPIAPALRFAAISELLAATAMITLMLALLGCVAPAFIAHLMFDPSARSIALRALVASIPSLALLLVGAHIAHGVALDLGAPRELRSADRRKHALRFGLYAAGWDVVLGPIGAVVVTLQDGFKGFVELTQIAGNLPGRSARAFLRGAYGLEGAAAKASLRASFFASAAAIVLAVFVTVGILIALLLS